MTDLDRTLREISGELEHPPTPRLVDAVGTRLRVEPPRRRLPVRRGVAIVLAAAILVPAGAVAAVSPLRDAVLDALGIGGVTVTRVAELPVLPAGGKLSLGRTVTAAEAERLTDYPVVKPRLPELAGPDEVYLRSNPPGGAVSFVYRSRPALTRRGLLLTEFPGSGADVYVQKAVGPGTSVQPVSVNGERGVWLAGRPHQFLFVDARGQVQSETLRLAGDTLLWTRGPLTLRLEGAISKEAALRIARAVG
jgi:hypothetical protein